MRRRKLLAWGLGVLASAAAIVLAGCGEASNKYILMSGAATGQGDLALNSGENYSAEFAPTTMATTPGDEIWVLPVDVALQAGGRGGGGGPMTPAAASPTMPLPGSPMLAARKADGTLAAMPLKHTDVDAKISGYIASVGVTQQFANPSPQKIDAVYVFPLPQDAGVSDFVMTIGDRHIRGIIRERADAERIYQLAREQGFRASMMKQEQPNIFTQSVANLEPGQQIDIHITYFHPLTYADGWLEWVFPMVASPHYSGADAPVGRPGAANGAASQRGTSARDIALKVQLDAGMPIEELQSVNHRILTESGDNHSVVVRLDPADTLPNKDFVLRYKVAGDKVKTAMFIQKDKAGKGGWFTLLLVPPAGTESLSRRPVETAHPVLANVMLAFDDSAMKITDIYPRQIPELSAGRPIVITGRYTGKPTGTVNLIGTAGNQKLTFALSAAASIEENPAIATLWARAKVADLRDQALHEGRDVSADIKATALSYGIISEFTNFIAVDSTQRTEGDHGTTAAVPAPVPEGARY